MVLVIENISNTTKLYLTITDLSNSESKYLIDTFIPREYTQYITSLFNYESRQLGHISDYFFIRDMKPLLDEIHRGREQIHPTRGGTLLTSWFKKTELSTPKLVRENTGDYRDIESYLSPMNRLWWAHHKAGDRSELLRSAEIEYHVYHRKRVSAVYQYSRFTNSDPSSIAINSELALISLMNLVNPKKKSN